MAALYYLQFEIFLYLLIYLLDFRLCLIALKISTIFDGTPFMGGRLVLQFGQSRLIRACEIATYFVKRYAKKNRFASYNFFQ